MKKNIHKLIVICLTTLFFCSACVPKYKPPESQYNQHYVDQFKGISLPDIQSVKDAGTSWIFSKPADVVWDSTLYVTKQYEGIIGLDTSNSEHKRLLYIHGQEMPMLTKQPPIKYSRFLDTWIAIAVEPGPDNDSIVYAAWVSPDTGKATPIKIPEIKKPEKDLHVFEDDTDLEDSESENKKAENKEEPDDGLKKPDNFFQPLRHATGLTDIGNSLSEERLYIAGGISVLDDPSERQAWIPLATINEFFYHLSTQLYGPERWSLKYANSYNPNTASVKPLPQIQKGDDANYKEHKKISDESGNWMSSRLRDTYLIIKSPELQNLLEDVVSRLKKGAMATDRATNVYIIASPEINAFSLPNGDIFVCTGLLETLGSVDELAAVLAHELDHYFQYDSINRVVKMEDARQVQSGMIIAGAMLGAVGGAFVGVAASGSAVMTQGISLSGQILSNVVTNTVLTMANVIGESMAQSVASGYSQESELRADSNGTKYLWSAGFDPEAELSLMDKLKSKKIEAKERNEPISSGLINAVPGLEKRTEEIQKTLSQLN